MDAQAFGDLTLWYQRELHVHCYRMLGSFEEAEDVVQETFLRAWRKLPDFDGANPRAWLYRIATNACTDLLRQRTTRPTVTSHADLPWLQPYPDRLLEEVQSPDAQVVGRETIELAFLATMQLLPSQQRAVLIMRDVIGWSAAETAQILELSVAAVNSALQRARATMRERGTNPESLSGSAQTELSAEERDLLQRYVALHERPDEASMRELVRDDIRITMPPQSESFEGWTALEPLHEMAFGPSRFGDWRVLPTTANRMPAAACYLRPRGEESVAFAAYKLDVIRPVDGLIAEITTFDAHLFPAFGLPPEVSADGNLRPNDGEG